MDRAEFYAAIKERGGVADLSHRAKFILTGSDRVRYLNGQVSNDVRKLTEGEAIYACVMTAKGKMCGDVFISAGPDFLRLDADAALREGLAARLERYIISDDVALEDVTEKFSIIHRIMPRGSHSRYFGEDDDKQSYTLLTNRFFRIHEVCDFFVERSSFESVWKNLGEQSAVIDEEMQEVLRIEAGIPRWGFELSEDTIPVEAGLDKTAIDYNKGCYIGQEVISRIKSVGHVNKELRGFVSDQPLAANMQLFAANDSAKSVGRLTSAAYSFGLARHAALGYLKRGVDASILTARDANDKTCEVEVRELPLIP